MGQIANLYEGLLGRLPDPLGGEDLLARLRSGQSLGQVTQSVLTSAEGQTHFDAGSSDTDYVNQLYAQVLNRTTDNGGRGYWVDQLQTVSRATVADDFLFSSEHEALLQPILADGVFVADASAAQTSRLYYGLLDRAPDANGLESQTAHLKTGTSLSGVAEKFLDSTEYQNANPNQNDGQYVSSLYQNALGRTYDVSGRQYWLDQLASGVSRADVSIGFTESAEGRSYLSGRIETGFHLI